MAKTTEELITIAETKATKAEAKRLTGIVKEQFAAAVEGATDKAVAKLLKGLSKDVLAALK